MKAILSLILIFSVCAPTWAAEPRRARGASTLKASPKQVEPGSNCPNQFIDELRDVTQVNLQSMLGGGLSCGSISLKEIERFDCNSRVTNMGRALRVTDQLDKIALQMFFQELASNSHGQANCRLGFFNHYLTNTAERERLHSAAQGKFATIKNDLKTLLNYKAQLSRELAEQNQRIAGDRAMSALTAEGRADYEQKIQETAEQITKLLLSVPMGYDPDIARELVSMGETGNFDENRFQSAMLRATEKYKKASEYYAGKFAVVDQNTQRGSYCLGVDYRNMAGRSGQIGKWVDGLPNKTSDEKSFRTKMDCRLEATYEIGQSRFNTAMAVAGFATMIFPPAAGARVAAAGLRVAAEAGTALNVGMKASAAASMLMTMEGLRQQCFPAGALVSGDRMKEGESCNAEADFNRAIEEPNHSACAMGAVMLAAAPLHIQTLLKASRINTVQAAAAANLDETAKIAAGSAQQAKVLRSADKLRDADRVAIAQSLRPGQKLTKAQEQAVVEAHKLPLDQAVKKARILRRAGFTQKETESLMRSGVTGEGFAANAGRAMGSTKIYKTVDDAEAAVYNASRSGNTLLSEAKLASSPQKAAELRKIAAESFNSAGDASIAAGRMHGKGLEAREAFKEADRLYRQAKNMEGSANAVVERLAIAGKPEMGFAEIRQAAKEAADAARANPTDAAAAAKAKWFKERVALVESKWKARGGTVPDDGSQVASAAANRSVAASNPAAAVPQTKSQLAMKGSDLRLTGKNEEASSFYLRAAEKPTFTDRNYSIAFEQSLKGSGDTAKQMALQAQKSGERSLNEFVSSLSLKSQTALSDVEKKNLLSTVQELRKLPPSEVHLMDSGALRKIESSLLKSDDNPVSQVSRAVSTRGKSDKVLEIYKGRLENGWSRESVLQEINQERRNADLMAQSIRRTRGNSGDWDRRVEIYDEILRGLNKP